MYRENSDGVYHKLHRVGFYPWFYMLENCTLENMRNCISQWNRNHQEFCIYASIYFCWFIKCFITKCILLQVREIYGSKKGWVWRLQIVVFRFLDQVIWYMVQKFRQNLMMSSSDNFILKKETAGFSEDTHTHTQTYIYM